MPVKVDNYQVTVRFGRLFPDPAVFDDPDKMARRYLVGAGISKERARFIVQFEDDVEPVDDLGKHAVASGTGKFRYSGRTIMAEYMTNASIRLEYVDFGTGLTAPDHSRLWKRQRWGDQTFELRSLQHSSQTFNIPEVHDLYELLKKQALPTVLSTVELPGLSDRMFQASASYIQDSLAEYSAIDGLELEVYNARDLSTSEKKALEKRLTRESSKNTVYVILSQSSKQSENKKQHQ